MPGLIVMGPAASTRWQGESGNAAVHHIVKFMASCGVASTLRRWRRHMSMEKLGVVTQEPKPGTKTAKAADPQRNVPWDPQKGTKPFEKKAETTKTT